MSNSSLTNSYLMILPDYKIKSQHLAQKYYLDILWSKFVMISDGAQNIAF